VSACEGSEALVYLAPQRAEGPILIGGLAVATLRGSRSDQRPGPPRLSTPGLLVSAMLVVSMQAGETDVLTGGGVGVTRSRLSLSGGGESIVSLERRERPRRLKLRTNSPAPRPALRYILH